MQRYRRYFCLIAHPVRLWRNRHSTGCTLVRFRTLSLHGRNRMSDSTAKSMKQGEEEEKLEACAEVKRLTVLTVFIVVVTLLALLALIAVHAQGWESRNETMKCSLKFGSAHARHRNVEDQTSRVRDSIRLKGFLGGTECLRRKTELLEQILKRLPHRFWPARYFVPA